MSDDEHHKNVLGKELEITPLEKLK